MSFNPKSINLVGTATIGPKGQVVIPVEVRDKVGLKPGDKMIILYLDKHKTIAFLPESEMQDIICAMGSHVEKLSSSLKSHSKE